MRYAFLSLCIAALAALSGCARSRITTEIKAGGAWTRTDSFTGQEKKEGQMAPSIDDIFVIPSGAEWKSHTVKTDKDSTVVVERTLRADDSLKGDVSIKADADKLQLVNDVTVRRVGPRRFEYRETLSWKAPKAPGDIGDIKPEQLEEIKTALPKPLATDANARALAGRLTVLVVPLMFGPGDPLLALGLMHPDLAERRASQRIGALVVKALEEQFGDKMSADQRKEVVRKVIAGSFASARPAQPDPSAGPPDKSSSGGLTPLMFVVKTPGRVISSNGELDEFTGEVYWALFPEAASLKDVTLTAVCELPE
ncbi:MAG: hypothetical protein ABSH47_25085 [Bryobacteraceae bacterium]|jgi:hypothetical protein